MLVIVYYESQKTVSRYSHLREANMSQGQPIRDASHLYEVERRVQHARVIMAWRDGKTNLSCSPRSPRRGIQRNDQRGRLRQHVGVELSGHVQGWAR